MANWKKVIKEVAPSLAKALGGPLNGTIMKALAERLLGKDDAPDDDVINAVLTASPEDIVLIKEIEADIVAIYADDRKDARKLHSISPWPQNIISIFILSFFFYTVNNFFVFTRAGIEFTGDPEFKDIIIYLLGALTTIATQVVGYHYGSSSGSHEKTRLIGR